jgi:peroxiredoxin (alkyl hydroperoxide reductase subunit C)
MAEQDIGMEQSEAIRIGEIAPEFTARSTEGMISLHQFRGRWLVFFSHPADFTPVCTSEFMAFAKAADAFAALDCGLLGHSVDSLFSHLAWIRALHDDFGIAIPFPVVEDPTLEIARAFGMVSADADTAASVRAVYIIDPEGIVRAINWYPINVGRSVAEILRLVAALKRTADGSVITPEGWQPGGKVLAHPDFLAADALASKTATGWFYKEIEEVGP